MCAGRRYPIISISVTLALLYSVRNISLTGPRVFLVVHSYFCGTLVCVGTQASILYARSQKRPENSPISNMDSYEFPKIIHSKKTGQRRININQMHAYTMFRYACANLPMYVCVYSIVHSRLN